MTDISPSQTVELKTESIAGNAVGDQPTLQDSLGFTPYVEAIARFLLADATHPPMSISIEGDWGSGKSSFLLQLENAISGRPVTVPLSERLPEWLGGISGVSARPKTALTVRFNAWRHDKQDALWAAFALAFVKALRSEVGILRAYYGDAVLFLRRMKGFRAWLDLFLLAASLVALSFGLVGLYLYISEHPSVSTNALKYLSDSHAEPERLSIILAVVASKGALGAIVALGAAGIYKFHSIFKMPLSLNLEKYLSKPDYIGHSSFIESFHVDLGRLVQAYAGKKRVFIFVDDLDRCDVPRAADLMQAINLMIGDSKNLIFIIGMDREKIAAGIALKYKEILPFLRETAHWKINDDKDDYTPLYFGYSYLEKFIQISFTLPVVADATALRAFLTEPAPEAIPLHWGNRLWKYWSTRLSTSSVSRNNGMDISFPASEISAKATAEKSRRVFKRLAVERDSERIQEIVRFVSKLFEYNPRRIKQFINTFRLALYIASDQGLFDDIDDNASLTSPEQLGKVIALLLRFPDLRYALELNPKLFALLEEEALKFSASNEQVPYHWLNKPGTVELLTYGLNSSEDARDQTLKNFEIKQLFSILPRIAFTAEAAGVGTTLFEALARRYEDIRRVQPSGATRTGAMNALANEALREAQSLKAPQIVLAQLRSSDAPGSRLMCIVIAQAHRDPRNLKWLTEYNRDFRSPFEHNCCLHTLIQYEDLMSDIDREEIYSALQERWSEIQQDSGRISLANKLRDLTAPRSSKPAPAE